MSPFCRTVTLFTDSTSIPDALSYFFMAVAVYMAFGRSIFDFHVPHNALCFPHKILHKNSVQTLVGVAIVSWESEHKTFVGKTNWIMGSIKVADFYSKGRRRYIF